MSLTIERETPHNALWYTPPGSQKPITKVQHGTNNIPSLTPDDYINLIRHHYKRENA